MSICVILPAPALEMIGGPGRSKATKNLIKKRFFASLRMTGKGYFATVP
jgi:hypothetical protein